LKSTREVWEKPELVEYDQNKETSSSNLKYGLNPLAKGKFLNMAAFVFSPKTLFWFPKQYKLR